MTYQILRMVKEWAMEAHFKNAGKEYKKALEELMQAVSKVMKFL